MAQTLIVNDVTQLNPVPVWAIATPTSVQEVQEALKRTDGPVSIGGGHFSMGGQTASPGSMHIDMRRMNRILSFSPVERTIKVEAGTRWCDIQAFVDPHGLSVKIMQTYANFTVGGSLSVNCHGRYIGQGPIILSVRWIKAVLADGTIVEATPKDNSEIFYAVIGCYGAIAVIVEVELELAVNERVERIHKTLSTAEYPAYFRQQVRDTRQSIFHNADLYAPHYTTARAVSWVLTKRPVTTSERLQPRRANYPLEKYFLWAFSETRTGKWRREHFIDPLLYLKRPVHWRNYEAGYDVRELEPPSRKHTTWVLQEYFVPVERFNDFVPLMAEIFQRHRANVLNVSVRHAISDPGSLLAWARGETFAFVVYYKQRTRENAKERVAVWTRELIDAVTSVGGTYYLPYQPHATVEQFHRAYPRARELFALKRKLDPNFRLRNCLWDKYYEPAAPAVVTRPAKSEFHDVYSDVKWSDDFYRFLQNVYHLYPEDRFHSLIQEACRKHSADEEIYRYLQHHLKEIKPFLADLTYALPALAKQKDVMTRQTLDLMGDKRRINGYVEIGSTGRYASTLRKEMQIDGPLVLVNDVAPTNSPPDIMERGGLRKLGDWVPLDNYAPLPKDRIPDASVDLVSCYIGLHHIPLDRLHPFMASIKRVLRPGGTFILRDHDVTTKEMDTFVSLAHTVFNAGLGVPWETNKAELRFFTSIGEWSGRLKEHGLTDSGKRLAQAHDPSDNLLLSFTRSGS